MELKICNKCGECDNCQASMGAKERRDISVEIIQELCFQFNEMLQSMATSGKEKADLKKFIMACEHMEQELECQELVS